MHNMLKSKLPERSASRAGVLTPLLILLAVAAVAAAHPAAAQERQIVSSQVTVAGGEATLGVEFADGEEMAVSFRDERVMVDGAEIGEYRAGGPLEAAWRSLLGQAVAMDTGEIVNLLRDWSPPADLEDEAAETGRALQERLASALTAPEAPDPQVVRPEGDLEEAIESLILRTDRLRALTSGLRELRTEDLRIYVGDDVTIEEGETVVGSLLVLDGHLTVNGEVEGDVLLLGGQLTLGDQGRIGGDLRWIDARIDDERRDAVAGSITEIQPVPDRPEADLRDEIRREVRAAVEAETRAPPRPPLPRTTGRDVLRNLGTGMAKLFQTLVSFGVLFGIGLVLLYFVPRNFEIVARTARHAAGRSALVGLAASVLSFPVWIAGIVLLAITVIGIPVMLLWIPLFPLALAVAATVGFLAVARILGRWMSHRSIQGFESLDASRPAIQLGAGLAVLLAAFALAAVFQMGGAWLSLFHGLLTFIGVLLVVVTGMIGLGAVILSRGGRDPLYAGPGWSWGGGEDPWGPDPDPFDPGPAPPPGGGPGEDPEGPHGPERRHHPGPDPAPEDTPHSEQESDEPHR